MSVLNSYQPFPLDDFGGSNQRGESSDVKPPWGIAALNCEFEPGFVRTRRGIYPHPSAAFAETDVIAGAYNHLYANTSYVFRGKRVAATNLHVDWCDYTGAGGVNSAITYANAAPGYVNFAGFGKRVYATLGNAAQDTGIFGVMDVSNASAPQVWLPPYTLAGLGAVTVTLGAPSSGQTTVGRHDVFMLIQTKSGFITRVGPLQTLIDGIPTSFAVFSANPNSTVDLSIAAPAGNWNGNIYSITLVATTSTNFVRKYIVPGQTFIITNYTAPVTFQLNMADATLATQIQATQYENVIYTGFKQTDPTVQPVQPYYCAPCGERMLLFYVDPLVGPTMAFSAPSAYEQFAFDRNMITLPGVAKPFAAKWTQGTIYIYTETGTFAYTDTGDDPVTWPTARSIDSKIGTSQPYGATVDSTGFGFVAHRTGVYPFAGGQYNQQALTYWQPDAWDQVDWSDPSFSITDDKEKYRCVVCCKDLFGVRHVYTWNYSGGYAPDQVKFSEYTYPHVINWVLEVLNYGDAESAKRRLQLWMQSSVSTKWVLDRFPGDATPYRDVDGTTTSNIAFYYRTAYLPPRPKPAQMMEHHYGLLRCVGSGNFQYAIFGLDDNLEVIVSDTDGSPKPLVVTTSPGKEYVVGYSMISESASLAISPSDAVLDTYIEISHWCHYYKPWSVRRAS